jgi:cysteinyl-tRNA synthetase
MELKLYDTLTREKRVFEPLDPAHVRMYVCGPTVYDYAHIGNARPVIVFDLLFRLLRHRYGAEHVTYVRNITDVDDKINARAAEEYPNLRLNEAIGKVTKKTYKQFHEDVAALGCLPPTVEPRATEHIAEMRKLINRLVKSGHAYVADDNVLFSVPSMPDYGRLSKRPLDEMIAGARVDFVAYKRDQLDFVLWKPSKPGEPSWTSPAGIRVRGRPGWHIECSAMAWKHLGETFDIHGGGIDLVFPHHEDEIAQTRCAFQTPTMASYWMHNGFLEVDGRKMSKSEGNFVTIHELLANAKFGKRSWPGDVVRFAMLQTPYTHPIDWTVRMLEQSESRLKRWRTFAAERTSDTHNNALRRDILSLLYDDLDTPAAFNLVDRTCNSEQATEFDRYTVHWLLRLMGFKSPKSIPARAVKAISPVVSKIFDMTNSDWQNLLTTVGQKSKGLSAPGKDTARLLASLGAIGELTDLLQSYRINVTPPDAVNTIQSQPPGNSQFLESFRAAPPSIAPTNRSAARIPLADRKKLLGRIRLSRSLRTLDSAIHSLSSLTVNDWNNLVETARRQPSHAGGESKPETKLLVYIFLLSKLYNRISDEIERRDRRKDFSKTFAQLIAELRPGAPARELEISDLVEARNRARQLKDFVESDRIRDELAKMGVVLKDTKDGTTWEIAR